MATKEEMNSLRKKWSEKLRNRDNRDGFPEIPDCEKEMVAYRQIFDKEYVKPVDSQKTIFQKAKKSNLLSERIKNNVTNRQLKFFQSNKDVVYIIDYIRKNYEDIREFNQIHVYPGHYLFEKVMTSRISLSMFKKLSKTNAQRIFYGLENLGIISRCPDIVNGKGKKIAGTRYIIGEWIMYRKDGRLLPWKWVRPSFYLKFNNKGLNLLTNFKKSDCIIQKENRNLIMFSKHSSK